MFLSKNRYGKKVVLDDAVKSDGFYWRKYKLKQDIITGLIHKYDPIDAEKYYEDDKFYSEHVVGYEWFAKEHKEYIQGYWDAHFNHLISRMDTNLPLLDVGCGAGWFINSWNILKGKRHYAYGIEPSKMARECFDAAKPFIFADLFEFEEFRNDELDKYGLDISSFNILMSLVLEHIPDPVSFIKQYLPYMGETGTLTIVVPNDFSPLQRWLGSAHFIQDVHVNYFTPQSLLSVIYDALPDSDPVIKYEVKMSATFPMEIFELLGFHYIEDGDLGRKCHNFRLKFEKFFKKYAFKLYEKLYDKFGIGRELVFTIKRI